MKTLARFSFFILTLFLLFPASATAQSQAPDFEFTIAIGETLTFDARGVSRVVVGMPDIATGRATGDGRSVILTGSSPGVTTVNIFTDRGQRTVLIRVVPVNPEILAEEVRSIMGDRSGVDVRIVNGRVLLEGEVASDNYKAKIEKMAEIYPDQVLNFTTFREAFVEGARMIALDVYYMQLAVTDRDNLGMGWGQFFGANATTGFGDVFLYYDPSDLGAGILPTEVNPSRIPYAAQLTGGGSGYYSVIANLNLTIDLLVEHGLIKTIQHGLIITETGTDADYQSGGTILIPVREIGSTNIIEKDFGLQVKVRPVLDFENRVKLAMEVIYSELDFSIGIDGIPGIRVNRINATVNMMEGQSVLVSAQTNTTDTSNETGFWLLSRIPILGWLFKSRSFLGQGLNTALFITPRVYEPGPQSRIHRTMIQGVFDGMLEAGARARDLPELSNASTTAAPAARPAPAPAPAPPAGDSSD